MSDQEMWEARYRDEDGHTPDGTSPHPLVVDEARAVLSRARTAGASAGQLHAADLGSGAGRHALALAELGLAVTAVDFAGSAHDLVRRDAVDRGVADLITPVVADVSSWRPGIRTFDLIVATYLHTQLGLLIDFAGELAPGGRLIWIGHAPESPHGPPPEVTRDTLADYRHQLGSLAPDEYRVLRLDEYRLSSEFLDIVAIVERRSPQG